MKISNDGTLNSEFENMYFTKHSVSKLIADNDLSIAAVFANNTAPEDAFPRFIELKKELMDKIFDESLEVSTNFLAIYKANLIEEVTLFLGRILLEKYKDPSDTTKHIHIFIKLNKAIRITTAEFYYTENDYDSIKIVVENVFTVVGVYESSFNETRQSIENFTYLDDIFYRYFAIEMYEFFDELNKYFFKNNNSLLEGTIEDD